MASHLMIWHFTDGRATEVLTTDRLIEAPNWTPDDAALIVNGDGRLWRVALAEPGLEAIDTGFAERINNDHGLSPDGARLAISDATETGESCVYTLPVEGGTPARVTEKVPSYWHGWSPDGATLAYVARRDGRDADICICPAEGGTEVRLTEGAGHHDGPEFTPDGEWLWFNSDRGGTMQLWRMPGGGGEAQQMTSDSRANWFPHPSPDGRAVLYLSYAPGVAGHPRDREVELRSLPASGGTPRVLTALFGGQGTINVPCWAPDSTRFAYVAYDRDEGAET